MELNPTSDADPFASGNLLLESSPLQAGTYIVTFTTNVQTYAAEGTWMRCEVWSAVSKIGEIRDTFSAGPLTLPQTTLGAERYAMYSMNGWVNVASGGRLFVGCGSTGSQTFVMSSRITAYRPDSVETASVPRNL